MASRLEWFHCSVIPKYFVGVSSVSGMSHCSIAVLGCTAIPLVFHILLLVGLPVFRCSASVSCSLIPSSSIPGFIACRWEVKKNHSKQLTFPLFLLILLDNFCYCLFEVVCLKQNNLCTIEKITKVYSPSQCLFLQRRNINTRTRKTNNNTKKKKSK